MDEQKFLQLIEKHARIVSAAIRRVCGRRYGVFGPDIEQDVRAALWQRLQHGKEIEHPVSYLYKMALTTALETLRRNPEVDELDENRTPREPATVAGTLSLLPEERAVLLGQLLAQLPIDEARAVRAHLAGFNHTEVAGLYGWTSSVARHRIYRGIEALKKNLKAESE